MYRSVKASRDEYRPELSRAVKTTVLVMSGYTSVVRSAAPVIPVVCLFAAVALCLTLPETCFSHPGMSRFVTSPVRAWAPVSVASFTITG